MYGYNNNSSMKKNYVIQLFQRGIQSDLHKKNVFTATLTYSRKILKSDDDQGLPGLRSHHSERHRLTLCFRK